MRSKQIPSGLRALALALLLTLLAFRCVDDGARVTVDEDTEPLVFERLAQGQRSAFADTTEIVVEDSAHWDEVVRSIPDIPQSGPIDFDQFMVLVAAVPAPSGGFDVHFRSVEVAQDHVIAHYAVGVPADDCITAMGLTAPYEAVTVRRTNLPVVFERSQELIRCTFR